MRVVFRCALIVVAALSEVVAAQTTGPSIAPTVPRVAFTQETLGNGLRVVYAPRHDWPAVNVRVVYHVGSKDEPAEQRGLAHLVEHLMFRGSAHVSAEERSRVLTRAGGIGNAATDFDTTAYFETAPANQLELLLWLEAERMASFDVSEESLTAERKIVEEEWARRRGVPFNSLVDDALPQVPAMGPYRWTPIGNMEQLRAVRVGDVKDFVTRWYGPNNAVLVVAGDFDVAKAQASIRRLFGWIAARATPTRRGLAQVASTQPRVLEVSGPVPWPAEVVIFPTPEYGAADEPAVRMLGMVLQGEWDGHLVGAQRPLASMLDVQGLRLEGGGMMILSAVLARGQKFDQLSDAIFAMPHLIYDFIVQKDLSRAAGAVALEAEIRRETAEGVASELGTSMALRGSPGGEDEELAAMGRVGVGRMGKLALKYCDEANAVTLHVMPGGMKPALPELDDATENPVTEHAAATVPARRHMTGFPTGYPESAPMASGEAVSANLTQIERTIDGVRVVILPDARTSAVHWAIVLRDRVAEPAGKEGVATLTARLLSAIHHRYIFDPRPRPRDLELAGTSLQVQSVGHRTVVMGAALPVHLEDALEMTRRHVFDPDFLKPDFYQEAFFGPRLRGDVMSLIASVERQRMDANALAWREIETAVFKSPPRRPTTQSAGSLTIDDVRSFYQHAYGNVGLVVVAGNVTEPRGAQIAKYLLDAAAATTQPAVRAAASAIGAATSAASKPSVMREHDGLEIVLVDCPGVVQCPVRIVAPSFAAGSSDAPAGAIAAHILADGLHSRMGRYVRCDRGYSYSTTARFFAWEDGGYFLASADTEPQNVASTVTSVLGILADMGEKGVSDDELSDAKAALVARRIVRDESAESRLRQQVNLEFAGVRGDDDPPAEEGYDAVVQQVVAVEVRGVMSKYVHQSRLTVVVAGPAAKLKQALQRIGAVRVVEPAD